MTRRTLAWALGPAALACAVALLVWTADLAALSTAWRTAAASPEEVGVALAAFGLAFVLRALAWSRVVPALGFSHALAAVHLSLVGNHILPLRLGEALRVTSAVRRGGIPVSVATASTVMLRGADLAAAVGLAALLGPLVVGEVAGPGRWLALALGACVWAAGIAWLVRLGRTRRGELRPAVGIVALTAVSAWALESVLVWRAAAWAGLEIGLADALVVTTVTIAAQALAVAPGGFGTYEAAAAAAFVALGADTGTALAAALTAHALTTGYALAGGAAALLLPRLLLAGRRRPVPAPSSEPA